MGRNLVNNFIMQIVAPSFQYFVDLDLKEDL